jgi:hypothetical protein
VRHRGNVGSLAALNVKDSSVINGAGKPVTQVEEPRLGFGIGRVFLLGLHPRNVSLSDTFSGWNFLTYEDPELCGPSVPCTLAAALDGDRGLLGFPIHVGDRHRPKRNQIDSGYELREERWQKLPVPTEKLDEHNSDTEIEYVVGGRRTALDEEGKNDNLQGIGKDRESHGGSKTRNRRDGKDGLIHIGLPLELVPDSTILRSKSRLIQVQMRIPGTAFY